MTEFAAMAKVFSSFGGGKTAHGDLSQTGTFVALPTEFVFYH